ncbi:17872_t:CDS:2, partial [Cetraspora pellucida]
NTYYHGKTVGSVMPFWFVLLLVDRPQLNLLIVFQPVIKYYSMKSATDKALAFCRPWASGHLVRYLVTTTIYWFSLVVISKGPMISIPTRSKGCSIWIRCNSSRVLGHPCFWQESQDFTYALTSSPICSQKYQTEIH